MTADLRLRIIRSPRRRKTISARFAEDGAVLEVLAPAQATDAELAPVIEKLRGRLMRRGEASLVADDAALARRAAELSREHFDGRLRPREIRYVPNQQHRYGSCTPGTGTIRISHRVASMPTWVRDYVIVHELAHLQEANHGPRFWRLVGRYPKAERARGYLMALGLESDDGGSGGLDVTDV